MQRATCSVDFQELVWCSSSIAKIDGKDLASSYTMLLLIDKPSHQNAKKSVAGLVWLFFALLCNPGFACTRAHFRACVTSI